MKYTIEFKATIEEDTVFTDEKLREIAKESLENIVTGKMTIITEDGRIVEVEK